VCLNLVGVSDRHNWWGMECCDNTESSQATHTLSDDEYRAILSFVGIDYISLRAVCHTWHRLWIEPSTWAGGHAVWAAADDRCLGFLCQHVLPALAQAAAFDTHVLALQLCGGDRARHARLSQRRFEAMPAVNSDLAAPRGWHSPPGGFHGVSENVVVDGPVARRRHASVLGMAALCADGPVPRDASGNRSFSLRIEAERPDTEGGIFVGFVATPPTNINFSGAEELWRTAVMWRCARPPCHRVWTISFWSRQ
jgi:hypothetical protein